MKSRADESGAPSVPVLSILFALGDRELHGYGIMKEVEARTHGRVTLLPTSLYSTLKRMLVRGWVEEAPAPDRTPAPGRPRRHYRITAQGREVAVREAERMAALLQLARSSGAAALETSTETGS